MNNIEVQQLKRDAIKYLKFDDEKADNICNLEDKEINFIKNQIQKLQNIEMKERSNETMHKTKLIQKRIDEIFKNNAKLKNRRILQQKQQKPANNTVYKNHSNSNNKRFYHDQKDVSKIIVKGRKPKILFISDVKGWAWWIKSEYIKEYLSDEFDISLTYLIGDGATQYNKVDQYNFDLYFTYGFSYIDFLNNVPKHKKITGVTAHRRKHVIFPKMKMAGHVHANSKMLLYELKKMGFKNAYYVPNGVNEKLFKPTQPIKKDGDLVIGHVGKETPLKGQREFILPAIQQTGCKSSTNLRTWKDKLPHSEMPMIYNQMDVFMVASTEDGTPNPALEAASCGRPIISNRIGNMPEFIKDGYNGFIVERKIGAYIEKINYFKENRDELIRMGKNARKTVLKDWTWKKQSENYRNMFRNIFEQ